MIVVIILAIIILAMCAALLIDSEFALAKNSNTMKNRSIIIDAICAYNDWQIDNKNFNLLIDYAEMEPYDKTLKRQFDWGYTRILPPEKFELVKPFIKDGKKK